MNSTPHAVPASSIGNSQRYALWETALIFAVFVLQGAWPVPDVNESVYLPKLKHSWNPDWAPRDFYLQSADAHGIFGHAVGWLSLWLPLPVFAWLGRLVTWWLMAWSWRRLSNALAPARWLAVISAALFVCLQERGRMAGEWVVGGFEAKGLAYVLVFVTLEWLVRNQWPRALIACGAATAFHGLVGGWSLVALGFAWLCSSERSGIVKLLPAGAIALVLAAIGIWPAIAMNARADADTIAAANQIYVYERLSHHLLPQAFRADMVLRHLLLIALFMLLWISAPRGSGRWRLLSFVGGAVLIALAGWLIAVIFQDNRALSASLLRYYWFRLSDALVPLGVALGATTWMAATRRVHPVSGNWRLGFLAGLAAFHLTGYLLDRPYPTRPRADKENKVADYVGWRHVTRWVSEHTPADALFLTPRSQQTFTWYSGRSEVATWKNLPQDAAGIVEWWQRMQAIHRAAPDEPEGEIWRDSLTDIPEQRLRQLAETYRFDYVVTDAEPELPLPLLYRNESYAVYKMD